MGKMSTLTTPTHLLTGLTCDGHSPSNLGVTSSDVKVSGTDNGYDVSEETTPQYPVRGSPDYM